MINSKSSYPIANELGSFVLIIIMRDLTTDIVNVTNSNLHVISVSNLHVISVNAIIKCSLCVIIISVILSVIPSIGLCSINN